jgi:two-component system, NtrC family, response regulator AtoC
MGFCNASQASVAQLMQLVHKRKCYPREVSDSPNDALSTIRSAAFANPIHRRTLLIIHGTETSAVALPMSGTLLVGRGSDCAVKVEHPSLSRHHLIIDLADDILRLTDLGSANGTQLAGSPVQPNVAVEFSANDPIIAGDVTFVVQCFRRNQIASTVRTALPRNPISDGTLIATGPVIIEPIMRRLYDLAARLARGQLCILINGETGVGKEVLADFIHRTSPRAKGPFVRVNCAALSDSLIESELFGHERGAFTGAQRDRIGLLESADGGTVMLDEIGEVSLAVQAKLLRVIEQHQLLRVGSSTPRPIDVRFIAATNRDLEDDVDTGRFRNDLFFRLAGAVLLIPPLRQRPQEIDALARSFAAESSRKQGRKPPQFADETLRIMRAHPWLGNARELRNVVERAVLLTDGDIVQPDTLSLAAGRFAVTAQLQHPTGRDRAEVTTPNANNASPTASISDPATPLRDQLADFERTRIISALERLGGNQRRAAEELGIPLRTLINRLETYGLPRPRKPK